MAKAIAGGELYVIQPALTINGKSMEMQANPQKKWYKRWWVIAIGIFVVTLVIFPTKVGYVLGMIAGKIYNLFN